MFILDGIDVEYVDKILFNSSTIRSPEIIEIRSLLRSIAIKDSASISKLNWVANRIPRNIRNGSSE